MRSLGEKCGVFGIYGKGLDASRLAFFGLFTLQHRGQESSGIATSDGEEISCHKGVGLVSSVFTEQVIQSLPGYIAVGHNRYSTSSGTGLHHAQPIEAPDRSFVLAHNGNLPSTKALEQFLAQRGKRFENVSDSRLMTEAVYALTEGGLDIEDALQQAFPLFTGAFSLLIMTKDKLIALRDTCGIRPLSIARLNGGYVVSSETCAFGAVGATFFRDVEPGEMVVVGEDGLRSVQVVPSTPKLDIFEFVYFSRPDSHLMGQSVYEVRKRFGMRLAQEHPLEADVVVPVPETAIPVAVGLSQASGIPFEMGIIKSRYIHRTFIEPEQHIREQGVRLKLAPLSEVIAGKKIIVVDDSIVRGTTSRRIVEMLFETGAKEVHFYVSSPPVRFPDFYGIDLSKQQELVAFNRSADEVASYIGATSVRYLSYEGMIAATGADASQFCSACFTGEYPIAIHERASEVSEQAERR